MRFSRGAALPETAVVLGMALTLIFGTFELGLIGFTQLSSDGAAFVAAHAAVLGGDAGAAISRPFPQIPTSAVTISASAPDTTDVPVDYQDSLPSQQTQRHGGLQVVRPSHTQASVAQDNVGIGNVLAKTVVGSGAIEPNMLVTNPGFDIFGNNANSSGAFNRQLSYFADDGNAPPYFIGFKFMNDCMAVAAGQGCVNATTRSLGLAEYLDGDNWAQPQSGIAPNGVFGAMLIHQRVYAQLAREADAVFQGGRVSATSDVQAFLPDTDPCVATVHAWDAPGTGTGFNWRLNTLDPLAELPGC